MTFTTLIGPEEAVQHVDDPGWTFVDCRYMLGRPEWGYEQYQRLHISGAVFADTDRDLSGPVGDGRSGRHPLPSRTTFEAAMSRLGIDADRQVVAYDELTGALAAARLWWLLKWAGHDRVAVLDGGFRHWVDAGLPCRTGDEHRPRTSFVARYHDALVANADEVRSALDTDALVLLDARATDRYRGENETIDPVAGHIPRAISVPYTGNLDPSGRFQSSDKLKGRFEAVSHGAPAESLVMYCGSGVTAAHDVLAHAHAGLGMPRLYPGSWSEWISDPERPIVRGAETRTG